MLCSAFFGEVRKAAFGLCTNRFRCLKRILNILGLLQHVWLTVLSHATEHVSQSEHTTLTNPGSRVNPHKRANNGSSEFAPSSMCTCTRAVTRIQSIFSVLLATHCGMFYGRLCRFLTILRSVWTFLFTLQETTRIPLMVLSSQKVEPAL